MSDFIVLGTDTDAGKTTFSLLWLARFHSTDAYWKPVETGDSDSEKIQRFIPEAIVYPTLHRFPEPVAPPLAARREGKSIPSSIELIQAFGKLDRYRPNTLIETFGSPFSPLTETELQIALIQKLNLPSILVSSSLLGTIGRTLQTLHALSSHGIEPKVVVLMGPKDNFAEEQLRQHWQEPFVVSMELPSQWNTEGVANSSNKQSTILDQIRHYVFQTIPSSKDRTQEFLGSDQKRIWHPYTSLRDPDSPLMVVGTLNEFLHLANGRKIIDGISSWWTIQHGHRHPVLMQALAEASRRFDHVLFAGMTHLPAVG
jgi:adenosylmethionine-8-amino-7-oxononanoate aminotransferase